MKKLSFILSIILCVTVMAGCAGKTETPVPEQDKTSTSSGKTVELDMYFLWLSGAGRMHS